MNPTKYQKVQKAGPKRNFTRQRNITEPSASRTCPSLSVGQVHKGIAQVGVALEIMWPRCAARSSKSSGVSNSERPLGPRRRKKTKLKLLGTSNRPETEDVLGGRGVWGVWGLGALLQHALENAKALPYHSNNSFSATGLHG